MLQSNQDEKGSQLDKKGRYQDMDRPKKNDSTEFGEVVFVGSAPLIVNVYIFGIDFFMMQRLSFQVDFYVMQQVEIFNHIPSFSVIPTCSESFLKEGCWTSQHDR